MRKFKTGDVVVSKAIPDIRGNSREMTFTVKGYRYHEGVKRTLVEVHRRHDCRFTLFFEEGLRFA